MCCAKSSYNARGNEVFFLVSRFQLAVSSWQWLSVILLNTKFNKKWASLLTVKLPTGTCKPRTAHCKTANWNLLTELLPTENCSLDYCQLRTAH
jgi:hypothetical protein